MRRLLVHFEQNIVLNNKTMQHPSQGLVETLAFLTDIKALKGLGVKEVENFDTYIRVEHLYTTVMMRSS